MQKKPILKIVLIVGLGAILVVGIFWVRKNFSEKKDTSQTKNDQKIELEKQLQQLKIRQKPAANLRLSVMGAAGGKC